MGALGTHHHLPPPVIITLFPAVVSCFCFAANLSGEQNLFSAVQKRVIVRGPTPRSLSPGASVFNASLLFVCLAHSREGNKKHYKCIAAFVCRVSVCPAAEL